MGRISYSRGNGRIVLLRLVAGSSIPWGIVSPGIVTVRRIVCVSVGLMMGLCSSDWRLALPGIRHLPRGIGILARHKWRVAWRV